LTQGPPDAVPPAHVPGGVRVYAALLRTPEAARLLGGALLGRAQLGMASLAILLVVNARTGSFADAGLAVGVFGAVGAAFTPVLGRLVDRLGQVVVLAVCGGVQSVVFVVLAIDARRGASLAELVATVALAGASLPPLASCMRALWPVLVPDPSQRETAYTLDAISQELIWTLGPLLVAVFVSVWSASVAMLACAALTATGITIFVTSPTARSWRAEETHRSWLGPLSSRRIRALLACIAVASLGTGICQVAIPAIGVRAGSPASAGVLLGVWSLGSMLGAIAFGAIRWRVRVATRYWMLYVVLAALTLPLVWCRSIPSGIGFAFVAGLPLAALIGYQYTLVSSAAPRGTLTEAFAWNSAAAFGALASGSALGGWMIKQYGLGAAFAVAMLAALAGAATAIALVRR
jgi:MFS family permease